jgi:hypothetical protein
MNRETVKLIRWKHLKERRTLILIALIQQPTYCLIWLRVIFSHKNSLKGPHFESFVDIQSDVMEYTKMAFKK